MNLEVRTPRQFLSFVLAVLMLQPLFAVPMAMAEPAPVDPGVMTQPDAIGAPDLYQISPTDGQVIPYDSFNIDQGETLRFVFGNVTDSVVNQVQGAGSSTIAGELQGRLADLTTRAGQIFIVNPAGVIFTSTAQVDVAQLFAAGAASVTFDGGNAIFQTLDGANNPLPLGSITLESGAVINADVVALIGNAIQNAGTINAGELAIFATGERVVIGDPAAGIFIALEGGAGGTNPVGAQVTRTTAASDVYAYAFSMGAGSTGEAQLAADAATNDLTLSTPDAALAVVGGLDLSAQSQNTDANVTVTAPVTSTGAVDVLVRADGNVAWRANADTQGGSFALEADSPGLGSDGEGDLYVGSPDAPVAVTTGGGAVTLIGGGFVLGDAQPTTIDAGAGPINVSATDDPDNADLALGGTGDLTNDELANLVTDGTLELGRARPAGAMDDLRTRVVALDGASLVRGAAPLSIVANELITGDAGTDLTVDGPVSLEAPDINGGDAEPLSIDGATDLAVTDTGPGAIDVAVTRADNPDALTSVTVQGTDYGAIDIAFPTQMDEVAINDDDANTVEVGNVNVDHDFSVTSTAGPIVVDNTAGNLFVAQNATVIADSNGVADGNEYDVDILGDLGAGDTLGSLTVRGLEVTVQGVSTSGSQSYTATATNTIVIGGNLIAGGDIDLDDNAELVGTGANEDQIIRAGEGLGTGQLTAQGSIVKTTTGNLTLGGDAGIDLDAQVAASDGLLTIENDFDAARNLSGVGVTLDGNGTLDGVASQSINAGAGALVANGTLDKIGGGGLTLTGAVADPMEIDVDLNDAVTSSGSLTITGFTDAEQNLTANGGELRLNSEITAARDLSGVGVTLGASSFFDGSVDQSVNANAGALVAEGGVIKTGAGGLTLSGNTVDLNSIVSSTGSLAVNGVFTAAGNLTGNGVTLANNGTLDGSAPQTIDASLGVLVANGTLQKTGGGSLTLTGNSVDLNDDVTSSGSLRVFAPFSAAGDLRGVGVTLGQDGNLDGDGTQTIEANTGALFVDGSLTKQDGGLVLGGDAGIGVLGSVSADGLLNVTDAFNVSGNLSGNGVTLASNGTLDGDATQTVNAGAGALVANGTLAKIGNGGLTLSGASADLNGNVSSTGALTVNPAFTATGNLSGNGVTLAGNGTLSGPGLQRIDANAGTLTANGTLTKGTGALTLGGNAGINLAQTVSSAGLLTIDDPFDAAADLSGGNVSLGGNGTLSGTDAQRIDGNTGALFAVGSLTKDVGALTLAGDDDIRLLGGATSGGLLTLENDSFVGGNLSGGGVTLAGSGTLNGSGPQSIAANAGTLQANGLVQKSTAGALALSGNLVDLNAGASTSAGSLTVTGNADVEGNLTANGGNLQINNAVSATGNLSGVGVTLAAGATLDGTVDQSVSAGMNTLQANALVQKTTAGSLTLTGGPVNLNGGATTSNGALTVTGNADVEGNLTATGGLLRTNGAVNATGNLTGNGVTLTQGATLDGAGAQTIEANAGTLQANGTLNKATGALTLGGNTGINVTTVNSGGLLTVADAFNASGNLLGGGVTLQGNGTLSGVFNGGAAQRIDANAGTLQANGTLTKGLGTLTLGGDAGIDLNQNVSAGGLLTIEDAFDAAADLTGNSISLLDDGMLSGASEQRIDATTGELYVEGSLTKPAGALTLAGDDSITLLGNTTSGGLMTLEDEFATQGNLTGAGMTFAERAIFIGSASQTADATTGALTVMGNVEKVVGPSALTLSGQTIALTGGDDQPLSSSGTLDLTTPPPGDTSEFSSIFKPTGDLFIGSNSGTTVVSKVTVANGDLFIGGGAVRVQDLNADAILIKSSSIVMTSRAAGESFDATGKVISNPAGADLVANRIYTAVPVTTDGTPGFFALVTPTGTELNDAAASSTVNQVAFSTSGDPIAAGAFGGQGRNDLTGSGPTSTDPSEEIAAVIADLSVEPQPPAIIDDPAASAPPTGDEMVEFLKCFPEEGRVEDLPEECKAQEFVAGTEEGLPQVGARVLPADASPVVTTNVAVARPVGHASRPASTPQLNALRIYRGLKDQPVVLILSSSVESYTSATGKTDVKGAEFRRYVEGNPEEQQALAVLNDMRNLVGELRKAGMTPPQFIRAARTVVEEMTPPGITSAELGAAVEGSGQTGWPGLWPEATETASVWPWNDSGE